MRFPPFRTRNLFASISLLTLLAGSTAGCTTASFEGITNSTGGALSGSWFRSSSRGETDWGQETAAAGERYRSNPRDGAAALRYAESLRKTGQRAQAAAVLQQASIHNPNDRRVLGAYGRALADTGNLNEALEMLGRAHTPDNPDWRVLSAQGAVLDQMGRHEEARRYYATALKIVPNEPSILSNLGLSYALSKDLRQAEDSLRKATARGSNERRVRQNLALVVGLQGRFKEAEEIARSDLPADEAAENITYLRQMLAEHESAKTHERARITGRAG